MKWPSELLKGRVLLSAPLPLFLAQISKRLVSLGLFEGSPHGLPNHVLVNEYLAGQGIDPHKDGCVYHPTVATITLGAHAVLDLSRKEVGEGKGEYVGSLLQTPRSCLVTSGVVYTDYLHGIEAKDFDELKMKNVLNWDLVPVSWHSDRLERGTRVSLTFRDVVSVRRFF